MSFCLSELDSITLAYNRSQQNYCNSIPRLLTNFWNESILLDCLYGIQALYRAYNKLSNSCKTLSVNFALGNYTVYQRSVVWSVYCTCITACVNVSLFLYLCSHYSFRAYCLVFFWCVSTVLHFLFLYSLLTLTPAV